MDIQFLIDSVVRQTTVLIAQLATAGGARAPLSHIAGQVFLELANELESQGVGRKVSADMFGMALRSYLRKIRRLDESATNRGRSLWSAILDFLSERNIASRAEVLRHFIKDDEELVRGVLHDLSQSGLVFRSGAGPSTVYHVATEEDLRSLNPSDVEESADTLVWVIVYRNGPLTWDELLAATMRQPDELDASLARLLALDRISEDVEAGRSLYHCHEFLVPFGESVGWEAAVYDHFQAMVQTIIQRLDRETGPSRKDVVGGSTYTFDVHDSHPMAEEVYGLLADFRERVGALRKRVEAHNEQHELPDPYDNVVVYGGQCVIPRVRPMPGGGEEDEEIHDT